LKQIFQEVVIVLVQQAVFSSGRSRQREGFHLVSRSVGLTKADAQLLVRRLPWCDALSPDDRWPTGTCYSELGDDSICISRSIRLSGGPVSRGLGPDDAAQLLTHCLVVPRKVFERFANNPFAILRAVAASGYVLSHQPVVAKLQPIRLAGRAPAVDHILLGNLARHPGPAAVAALVHEAIERIRLIVVGARSEELIAGLMSVLPVADRPYFSFSVGLRPSLRRPVRIVAVPESSLQIERFARQCRYKVLKLNDLGKVDYHGHAWATLVEQALEEADFSRLAEQVMSPAVAEIGESNLAAHQRERRSGDAWAAGHSTASVTGHATAQATAGSTPSPAVLETLAAKESHGAANAGADLRTGSARANSAGGRAATAVRGAPSAAGREPERARLHHDLAANDPASLAMLEELDDLVYDAIAGRPGAFEELTEFWPSALAQLEGESLVESREQYVRYALGLWGQGDAGGIQDPQRAMGALDVLCLLFPEGEF